MGQRKRQHAPTPHGWSQRHGGGSAVAPVRTTFDMTRTLEAIDHARDPAGGQLQQRSELAWRELAGTSEVLDRQDFGVGQAEPAGECPALSCVGERLAQ
jgi:hypothetical protein